MRFVYPYKTEPDGNSIVIEFPDVPGAVTQIDSDENFDELLNDCLVAALGGYVATRQPPPLPSPAKGSETVTLDVITSAKLALAIALSKLKISNVEFARHLGVTEKVVRRLLDLDHASKMARLECALDLLGQRLELRVHPKKDSMPFFQLPNTHTTP